MNDRHSALQGYTGLGTTWYIYNEINFSMNHAPGAGSIATLTSNPARYHWATCSLREMNEF